MSFLSKLDIQNIMRKRQKLYYYYTYIVEYLQVYVKNKVFLKKWYNNRKKAYMPFSKNRTRQILLQHVLILLVQCL